MQAVGEREEERGRERREGREGKERERIVKKVKKSHNWKQQLNTVVQTRVRLSFKTTNSNIRRTVLVSILLYYISCLCNPAENANYLTDLFCISYCLHINHYHLHYYYYYYD